MSRQHLTDSLISALEFTGDSESRYEIFDASIPNLGIRVGSKKKSFIPLARYSPDGNSTRRLLGRFPRINTEAARLEAHRWNVQIASGIDPAIQAAEARRAETLRLRSTFASVMLDYIAYLPSRDNNLSVPSEIQFIKANILNPKINPWMYKPIAMIDDEDIAQLIGLLKRRAPSTGFTCFRVLKTFFRWAMAPGRRKKIGLEHSPLESMTAKSLELAKQIGQRVLGYEEVRAYLMASTATPYPYGPCLRVLIETGQRIGAVSGMKKSQLNLERKIWIIPGPKSGKVLPGRSSKTGHNHVAIYMPTIFVAGNHEFYKASKSFNDEIMYAQGYEPSGRVEFLENSSVEFGGVRFIGATLWTDFGLFGEEWSEIAMRNAAMSLNDYRLIKFEKDPFSRFTPGLSRLKHVRGRHCIESALLAFHDQKTVVVNHHAPSIWSIEDRFLDDLLTASYASNLEEVMIRHEPALWIHGHVHHRVDYTLGKTRVIANPRGYPDEPNHQGYDFGYVVEI